MCIRDRFYIKYTEYKKRVAHANAGGALQREVVSIEELIPSHVQKVFARVYHESRTISPTQLLVAVESHAGHGEGAEVELSAAYAAVARVPPLVRRRWRRRRCCQQQRPAPAWLEIGRFLGEVGVLSVWPARSYLSLIHISSPRDATLSRMPSSA